MSRYTISAARFDPDDEKWVACDDAAAVHFLIGDTTTNRVVWATKTRQAAETWVAAHEVAP